MADIGRKRQPEKFEGESKQFLMGIPIEEFHEEMTPVEYVRTFLNSREKRYIKELMKTGEFAHAHKKSGFSVPSQNVLARRHIKIAIYRMAPLVSDPKVAGKMLHPLITEHRLRIAMTAKTGYSMRAMDALSEQANANEPRKNLHVHSIDRVPVDDRPWARPMVGVKTPPSLPEPQEETEDEVILERDL